MIKMKEFRFELTAIPADSDWRKCITSFLSEIYRKCESPYSHDHFRTILEAFFASEPRKLPHLYNREDVERFINSPGTAKGREGRPVKMPTINNRLSVIHCLYRYAQSYGVQGDDGHLYPLFKYLSPTAGVKFAKYRRSASTKSLSDEELRVFFAAIPRDTLLGKRDFSLLCFYFWSARRRSEIVGLRRKDIEQTLLLDEKGSRLAWVYRWKGKGHASIDDIAEIPPVAATALFEYMEESGRRVATMEPDDALFTALPDYQGRGGYDPKRPLADSQVNWIIHFYSQRAGLDRNITAHTFRHTSARVAYQNGASIRDVQQKLRHSSAHTTSLYIETLVGLSDNTLDRLHAFANL